MLNVENVSLHYGAAQALRDVSFKAEMGKITCVLGRNGVGKSSLLRAVTGQHPVTSGTISFNGARSTAWRPSGAPSRARLRAPGPRDLSPADGEGKSRNRLRSAEAGSTLDPRRYLQSVSGTSDDARPEGRRPFGRPAAAARDRSRSRDAPENTGAGRADRGHPAVDHQGHRPRDQIFAGFDRYAILLVEQYLDFCRELADHVYIMDRGAFVHEGPPETLDTPQARRHLTV